MTKALPTKSNCRQYFFAGQKSKLKVYARNLLLCWQTETSNETPQKNTAAIPVRYVPLKKTMRLLTILIFFLLAGKVFGQNFILPEGEFMDTTSNYDEKCKDYNLYYYQVGGKYPENSASLLKEAKTYLQKDRIQYTGTGYVTFRFRVDCEGNIMKKVEVLQTDDKYKNYHFDKARVNSLFSFIKILDKWRIVKTKEGDPFSYNTFITFKIKNGEVINIIP